MSPTNNTEPAAPRDTPTATHQDNTMPHVIIKLQTGRSDAQKSIIADEITKALMASANVTADAVSVSLEDIEPDDWVETVYRPDIIGKPATLFKKPGYDPL
jgi:4-oxalocrotonate tautomerase